MADVEFAAVVEEGAVEIQLDDVGFCGAVGVLFALTEDSVEFVDLVDYGDAVAAV